MSNETSVQIEQRIVEQCIRSIHENALFFWRNEIKVFVNWSNLR